MPRTCLPNHTKTCLGAPLDDVVLVSLLTACAKEKNLLKGSRLHATFLQKSLLRNNLRIGNALVSMYAKCGSLPKAQEVFHELLVRDKVSWNALSSGYVQHGHGEGALDCFQQLQQEGISPDAITFTCVLKACGNLGAIEKGKEMHARIVTQFWKDDVVLCSALVGMYSKCGALVKAKQVFDGLPVRNEVSWNVLIAGFCKFELYEEALDSFEKMKCKGMSPNAMTLACVLKVCGSLGLAERGENIHAEIVRKGLLADNTLLGSALMDMYVNQGALSKAQTVFDEFRAQDTVAWTGLITAYCQYGYSKEALKCYEKMRSEGSSPPNAITFACILKACGGIAAADEGKDIHVEIVRKGLLSNDTVLGSALADMYAKCGKLARAWEVFDKLPDRDAPSWNALIVSYCEWCHDEKALNCFEQMKLEDISPDIVTFSCILKAYGSIGAAEKGEALHAEVVRRGFLEDHIDLGNALVCMYVNCGKLEKAHEVFHALPARDVVSWNGLMSGYCEHGHGKEALASFEQMKCEGFSPDAVTFVCVLKACGSMGVAAKGEMYFETMAGSYGVIPCVEHNTCMVDLFMRAGDFDKAMALVKRTTSSRIISAWLTLLGSCRKSGNAKLGRVAFKSTVQLS